MKKIFATLTVLAMFSFGSVAVMAQEAAEAAPVAEEVTDAPAVETSPEPETAVAAETAVKTDEAKDTKRKKARTHTVKWYENLNDIAAKYGITTEELMAANGLKGKKLKSRMKLVIPAPGEFAATEETL